MFAYQKNFSNPTLPVDEAQFWALVRASKWNESIDKYRETFDAAVKRKLPAFIFQATFDETTSKAGKLGRWRKQSATRLTGLVVMDVDHLGDGPTPNPSLNGGESIVNENMALAPRDLYAKWRKELPELFAEGGSILLVYIRLSAKKRISSFWTRNCLRTRTRRMARNTTKNIETDTRRKLKRTRILRMERIIRQIRVIRVQKIIMKKICVIMESNTKKFAKRGRPRKAEHQPLETAIEQCCNWLSTSGISATTNPRWSIGCSDCVDLCRTSSENGAIKKSLTLLIRLVSESYTRTSPRGCKGCLKVWVFTQASPTELQSLWEQLKCLTNSSLKGWSLSFAPLMPKPVKG